MICHVPCRLRGGWRICVQGGIPSPCFAVCVLYSIRHNSHFGRLPHGLQTEVLQVRLHGCKRLLCVQSDLNCLPQIVDGLGNFTGIVYDVEPKQGKCGTRDQKHATEYRCFTMRPKSRKNTQKISPPKFALVKDWD